MSLQKLLNIREKRKDRVFTELRIAKNNIANREKMWLAKREELENYYMERAKKKKQLFDKLSSKGFTTKEYTKYRAKLNAIDQQEKQYTERLKMAENLLQKAEEDYWQLKKKSNAVIREVEKLTEILKDTNQQEKQKTNRQEEIEADDFSVMAKLKEALIK